jgi:hypothetical protein
MEPYLLPYKDIIRPFACKIELKRDTSLSPLYNNNLNAFGDSLITSCTRSITIKSVPNWEVA